MEELKRRGRKEAVEHTTLYRSWGSVSVLGEGSRYRMKKIRVKPGGKLSLQMHYHRSEHWIVISGTAKVTMGNQVSMVHENESVFIPQTMQQSSPKSCVKLSAQYLMVLHLDIISRSIFPLFRLIYQ